MKEINRQRRNRSKVYMTLFGLVTAIVVLGMAAYAWYTLSTNPEVKGLQFNVNGDQAIQVSKDGENFSNSEDLSSKLQDYAELVPVSTVDGLNWFECKYDTSGNVLQEKSKLYGNQFRYLRFPNGGNVKKSGKSDADTNTNTDTKDGHSYYIYTDIYLRTQEKKADVYLTIPSDSQNYQSKADDTEKNHYGSYVMSFYKKDNQITLTQGGSETSARVGFLMLGSGTESPDADGSDESKTKVTYPEPEKTEAGTSAEYPFFIYEPNADLRSQLDKSSDEYKVDKYIAGFEAKNFYGTDGQKLSYAGASGYYFPTYPVKMDETTLNQISEMLNAGNSSTEIQNTLEDVNTYTNRQEKISVFPSDHLIVQKKSTWRAQSTRDDNTSSQPEGTQEGQKQLKFDSTLIGQMGTFISADSLYQTMNLTADKTLNNSNTDYHPIEVKNQNPDLRSGVKLTTLYKDKPQKVRLYFWLEGQDIDCWNDIADTDFLVNLEFAGDVK